MKKEYVFPYNNWYLEFTEEERPVVDNWRINIIKFSNSPCPGNYITYYASIGVRWEGCCGGKELITFAQFEQYVLNINKEFIIKEPQDYSYLIPILQQLNINK